MIAQKNMKETMDMMDTVMTIRMVVDTMANLRCQ